MIKLADVKLAEVIPPSIAVDAKMRAIADAVDVELNKQPGLIKSIALWAQLNTLPSGVLDHLAWQFNVPVWRDSWPQSTKVSVLRTAIRDKSVVGTRGAVERAVESLGSAVQIVEWFEAIPQADPYTFEIIIDLNSIPGQADVETQDDLRRAVDAAKPARSHYRVILSLKLTGLFGMYATGRPAVVSVLRGVSVESFDPLTMNPWAFWDAADVGTLYVDAAGTIPAVLNDPIGCIKDKSGNSRHATQTVSANRPIYDIVGSLRSDNINQLLRLTANIGYPRTIFAWAGQWGGVIGWVATAGQFSINVNTTQDLTYAVVRSAAGVYQSGAVPWGTSKHVIAEDSGTAVTIYSDAGTASAPLPAGASVTPAAGNQFVLFRGTRFKRVMIFDRLLTADERAKLLAWAATQG